MVMHFTILAWKILWTEKLGGLQWGRRVRHNLETKQLFLGPPQISAHYIYILHSYSTCNQQPV